MEGASEINVLQYFHQLDQKFTLALNSWNSPVSDCIWQFFSNKFIWIALYAVVVFFLFRRLGWRRALVYVIACALTILACDQFSNLVKDSVQRLRPCWDLNMVNGGLHILEGKGGKYGFFSAHAVNAAAFAVGTRMAFADDIRHSYKRYSAGIAIWAFLVGISRVFVGKHFLGDVLVGFVTGILIAVLVLKLSRVVVRCLSL